MKRERFEEATKAMAWLSETNEDDYSEPAPEELDALGYLQGVIVGSSSLKPQG